MGGGALERRGRSVSFQNPRGYPLPNGWRCLMRWEELSEQPCSLARVLAILGDRWTLLVLRDCFLGVRRFDDFERSLGVTRHVLADRLKRLVEAEILAKVPYQERPLREEYRLTEKGMELYPAILSLVNWGDRHLAGRRGAAAGACAQALRPAHAWRAGLFRMRRAAARAGRDGTRGAVLEGAPAAARLTVPGLAAAANRRITPMALRQEGRCRTRLRSLQGEDVPGRPRQAE